METQPLVEKPATPTTTKTTTTTTTAPADPLRYLLKVGHSSEFFESHLKTEYSVENILFWRAVEEYRQWYSALDSKEGRLSMPSPPSSTGPTQAEMEKEAQEIYNTYLAPKAPQSVNISGELRGQVTESMKEITPLIFDSAQNAIYDLMKSDAFPRFKNKTAEMVEASWKRVSSKGLEEVGTKFYERLFFAYPQLEKLFNTQQGMKGRMGKMVVGVMNNTVNFIEKLDQVIPTLQAIGARHASYGVELEYFTYLGHTFLWLLEHEEEEGKWNEQLENAWTNLYQLVAGVMAESMMQVKSRKSIRGPRRSINYRYVPLGKTEKDTLLPIKGEERKSKEKKDKEKETTPRKSRCGCTIL